MDFITQPYSCLYQYCDYNNDKRMYMIKKIQRTPAVESAEFLCLIASGVEVFCDVFHSLLFYRNPYLSSLWWNSVSNKRKLFNQQS